VAAIPVRPGDALRLTFEHVNSPWRQGVWLATEGLLVVSGQSRDQFVLWADSAPPAVEIVVDTTDGLLRLYNVWDSGRGLGRFESQRSTSGMIRSERHDGSIEFRCNDIGTSPDFNKLVFALQSYGPPGTGG
jgi:hypothetical protein